MRSRPGQTCSHGPNSSKTSIASYRPAAERHVRGHRPSIPPQRERDRKYRAEWSVRVDRPHHDGSSRWNVPDRGRVHLGQPTARRDSRLRQMVDLEVKKADQHQVDQPFRLPLGRVADLPVDSLVPVTRPCQIDRHRRVVDRSHRPTLPSHPPRVTAVAAGQIDRGARSQIGNSCCDGSRRVDSPCSVTARYRSSQSRASMIALHIRFTVTDRTVPPAA